MYGEPLPSHCRLRTPRGSHLCLALSFLLLVAIPLPAASQSLCRFYIADQYDYSANRGFYLDLEGSELATLPIFLCVADGDGWRWPRHTPGFQFDRDYRIHAVISPIGAQLSLDGVLVIDSPGAWQPAGTALQVSYRPSWASEPGDWVAVISAITVSLSRDGEEIERHEFEIREAAQQVPLTLFETGLTASAEMDSQSDDSVAIEATLRFGRSELAAWAPFIDRYGQCIYADFPEKVHSDDDLVADIAGEDALLAEMPPSASFDQYGGYRGHDWALESTGFFRAIEREGFWWLISPEGNPCFYLGVCLVPAQDWPPTPTTGREHLFEWLPPHADPWEGSWKHDAWGQGEDADYVNLYRCNLIRKYGEEGWYDRALERALRRLDAWAFSGGGKWGAPEAIVSTPVLYTYTTPVLVRHPDIFDPAIREQFRSELQAQIEPRREDPNVLGWSFQSEYDALITGDEIREILAKPGDTPSKRALLDHALDALYEGSLSDLNSAWGISATDREELYAANPTPPEHDVEALRRWYAHQCYDFVYTTIKSIDPNHLYIGPWIVPGWWEHEEDWRLQAAHCDVIGYDRYAMEYDSELLARLQAESGKPALCGEFSFPPFYQGERGFGRYWSSWAQGDAQAGQLYYDWIHASSRDPHCVGMIWFHYRDQPLTGRGSGFGSDLVYGEHYAFGLVTETDRVKWPLVRLMREANLQAPRWRMQEMTGRPFPDVPPDHWAVDEIGSCSDAGIVSGYADGFYRPHLVVARDQMAVYVSRALAGGDANLPGPEGDPTFPDVLPDHWAHKHIEYAVDNNVVEGYPDGNYHPDWQLNRAQMAVFIARSIVTPTGEAGLADYIPPPTLTFPDVPGHHWSRKHIEYLAESDIADGYADGLYRPTSYVTRDQMAVYVARAFELPL